MSAAPARVRIVYGITVIVGAAALLYALTQPLPGIGASRPWRFSVTPKGKAIITASNVTPGTIRNAKVTVRNTGRRPIRMYLTQDRATTGGMGPALQLMVYDTRSKRCIYPTARRGKCRTWGAWRAGSKLNRRPLLSRRGYRKWPRRESHVILLTWRLAATSTNTDQGRRATFRLRWRATQ